MSNYIKIGFSLLRLISVPLLNFLTLTVGITLLGSENWGRFVSVSLWVYLLAFLLKWSGQNYLVKVFSRNPSKINALFFSNLIERSIFLIFGLILFWAFPFATALSAFLLLLLLHLYHSLEALVIYFQKFSSQLVAELLGFGVILIGFYQIHSFTVAKIMYLFCLSVVLKIIWLLITVKPKPDTNSLLVNWRNLYTTLPFFLVGFSGWLASKIDLYVTNYYFSKEELAAYQLPATAFLMIQGIAGYMILPFSKHLYRLPKKTIHKIRTNLALVAVPLALVSFAGIWIILEKVMTLHFSLLFYAIGTFSAIPTFFYVVDHIQLYRHHKEMTIVKLSLASIIISLIVMLLLIPKLHILGIITAVCITQWLYLFMVKSVIPKERP